MSETCPWSEPRAESKGSRDYNPSKQQILGEGKLARLVFSARLQRVMFGTFNGNLSDTSEEQTCMLGAIPR